MERYDFGTNCVCVGRVSTSSQSQTAQIRDLEDYAKELGFQHIKTFFTTESGFLDYDDKQGWNLVVDFFDSHPDYRVLICAEISRLSRVKSTLMRIEEYLTKNRIQLIIKDINYTLFNEFGEVDAGKELVFTLYASLASSEMRQKRERFKRGLTDYKQQGYSIGGKILFGYNREYEFKNGRNRSIYRINKEQAEEIKTIYRWYAFGLDDGSIPSIRIITQRCIELGMHPYLHSERNVNKCLKEQAYTGQKETHNKTKNPDYWNYKKQDAPKYKESNPYICVYPPIFVDEDRALFDLVQDRLRKNQSKKKGTQNIAIDKSTKHTTILSKKIVCPVCGRYLQADYRKHDNRPAFSYRCGYSHGDVNPCSFKNTLSLILMDSVVWRWCKHAADEMITAEEENRNNQNIEDIKDKINNLENKAAQFDNLVDAEATIFRNKSRTARTMEAIDRAKTEYSKKVADLEKERMSFESRISELYQELHAVEESKKYIAPIAKNNLLETDKKKIYLYVHKLVDKIEILYTDALYTLFSVKLYDTISASEDKNDYYICLSKRHTQHPRALSMKSMSKVSKGLPNEALWDANSATFVCGDKKYTPKEICEAFYNRKPKREFNDGLLVAQYEALDVEYYLHLRELKYEKLQCYADDMK